MYVFRLVLGFLIAEKSYNHPIIGTFAKLAGAVPVKRPQDSAKKMTGKITINVSGPIGGGDDVQFKER